MSASHGHSTMGGIEYDDGGCVRRQKGESLALTSIDGHLHSPLICLVDVRLSSPFLSSPQPPLYSTYSVISMAHAHVLRES